jgi:hypothetical protein
MDKIDVPSRNDADAETLAWRDLAEETGLRAGRLLYPEIAAYLLYRSSD